MVADGSKHSSLLPSVRLLLAHGEVVRSFARRSLQIRYKQSVLGVLWALIQPLATLGVFVLFFGRVAKISGGGVPYAAFALSALGPWQFVNSAVSFGSLSIINEGALLRKVYFPREAPVLGAVGSNLVDLTIMIVLLCVLEPLIGGHIGLSIICLPLLVISLVVPVLAVALPLAALGVYYRDVKYIVPFLVQFGMFATPVVYPLSRVPSSWRIPYALINPFVGPLDSFRRVFSLGLFPDWQIAGLSFATGAVTLLLGYKLFKILEPDMADVV
jgi:lipopolysaccharide transport system permease protein